MVMVCGVVCLFSLSVLVCMWVGLRQVLVSGLRGLV